VPLVVNGWTLLFHPVFGDRYEALRARGKQLKATLPEAEFKQHSDVKLWAAARRAISETIPAGPNHPDYWLKRDLAKFRRLKGHGLPDRYRLFHVFSEQAKVVIYLYLNDSGTLRKEGSKTDPYAVFKDLVDSGKIGADFDENLKQWKAAQARAKGAQNP
jgi:toxin YhaV